MSSKKAQQQKRPLEMVEGLVHRAPTSQANMFTQWFEATGDPTEAGDKENWEVNTVWTPAKPAKKAAEAVKARDLWDTPGIVQLDDMKFLVKVGDNVTLQDSRTLFELFPEFAAAAAKFARELEMEHEGFITTAMHSLVWPTPGQKRHHVYTQISGQAGYVERTKYPQYLKDAIRSTWHSLGEEFSDPESDDATEIIKLSSDSDPDYDPE